VYGFVFGFELQSSSDELRREFAQEWKNQMEAGRTADHLFDAAIDIANEWKQGNVTLTVVKCGQTSTC
jgi:hypothetical protein